jgi:hypothetical protein
VLSSVAPFATEGSTWTTTVTVADADLAIVPRLQVMVVVPEQEPWTVSPTRRLRRRAACP